MYKKPLVVALAVLAVLGGLARPTASTKADEIAVSAANQQYTPIQMRITAYSSSPDETDYNPEYTASGLHVADGIVASNLFPFGTKIKIPALFGDKVFTVQDRMSTRFQRTIDIWMPSKQKALNFGVAYTKILVFGTTTLASYNPPERKPLAANKDISANLR
jgi:3D (Asp-Asp-Asp) domain-containing protein